MELREFPGGPVVRTPRFHCRGHRFESLVRELGSCKPHSVAKKKKELKLSTKDFQKFIIEKDMD